MDKNGQERKTFSTKEPISISIDYSLKKRLGRPVFAVEILRSDGIVCCESNTKDTGFPMPYLDGKGTIQVTFFDVNLIPEMYYVKVSIWDEEILHPYVMKRMGVFKVENESASSRFGSVLFVRSKWAMPS